MLRLIDEETETIEQVTDIEAIYEILDSLICQLGKQGVIIE